MTGFSRAEVVRDKSSAPSRSARDFTIPHRARMLLVVPDGGDRRRSKRPSMSAVGAAGGVRASGGRYGVRRWKHRAMALLQAGVVVGGESTLGVATLARLLGADLLVLGRYPTATRITRASILAIATQIVGWSFNNGLHRSDNRRVASPFSIARAAAHPRRARN